MRYLISVKYDGSKFSGFQRLNKLKSVQQEIEKALTKINKKDVFIKGSGRTDAGVHALDQKCHFDLDINISPKRLEKAINSLLNDYIYVNNCSVVNNEFHARFFVKRKHYMYVINLGEYNPIMNDYIYNYCKKLDLNKLKKASKYLIGKHSFKAFVSGLRENYDSEIYKIKISRKKNIVSITFVGKSFYRYMVRNLVGALILVGENKLNIDDFKKMVDLKEIKHNYMTVPPNGLYLMKVEY